MTKYILNSGGIRRFPELKKAFHNEIVKGLSNTPRILLCNFAQAREYWESKYLSYKENIIKDLEPNINPIFELAYPDKFINQCNEADVIYFHGGDDHLLQYWIKQFDILNLFKDRVVATNSASSDMLVAHYWTSDWRQCADGLGIIPIKFIPHYKSNSDDPRGDIDWDKAYNDLVRYGDSTLPIYALEEGKFIIVNQ